MCVREREQERKGGDSYKGCVLHVANDKFTIMCNNLMQNLILNRRGVFYLFIIIKTLLYTLSTPSQLGYKFTQ